MHLIQVGSDAGEPSLGSNTGMFVRVDARVRQFVHMEFKCAEPVVYFSCSQ